MSINIKENLENQRVINVLEKKMAKIQKATGDKKLFSRKEQSQIESNLAQSTQGFKVPKSKAAAKKSKSVVKKEAENLVKNENLAIKSKTPTRQQATKLKQEGKGQESSQKPKESG